MNISLLFRRCRIESGSQSGQGWKIKPFIVIEPGKTSTLAEIDGSGAIQHIWMTPTGK